MGAMHTRARPAHRRAAILSAVIAILGLAGPGVGSAAATGPGVSWTPAAPVWPLHQGACSGSIASTTTPTRTYLHAVTATALDSNTTVGEIVYRRSANLGATWPAAVQLTSNHEFEECPRIAAAGSTVVVAWEAETTLGLTSIKLRVSTNHGITWGPIRRIPGAQHPGRVSIAVGGRTIFVTWTDTAALSSWAWIAMSRDNGLTWTKRRLDAKFTSGETLVAASGATVVTAWLRWPGQALVTRLSLDGGNSWRYPVVTHAADPSQRVEFSLAARGERVAVAWAADREPSIDTRVATNGVWAPLVPISAQAPGGGYPYGYLHKPAISLLSATRVGVAFAACYAYEFDGSCGQGTAGTIDDALWAESTNNGAAWTTPVIVSSVDTVVGGQGWSNVARISVAWPSRDLRAVLVWRMSGETEWLNRDFYARGYGLP